MQFHQLWIFLFFIIIFFLALRTKGKVNKEIPTEFFNKSKRKRFLRQVILKAGLIGIPSHANGTISSKSGHTTFSDTAS